LLVFHYSAEFGVKTDDPARHSTRYRFSQSWSTQPLEFQSNRTAFRRSIQCDDVPDGSQLTMRLIPSRLAKQCQWDPDSRELLFLGEPQFHIRLAHPQEASWSRDGLLTVPTGKRMAIRLDYVSAVPSDQVLVPPPVAIPGEARTL